MENVACYFLTNSKITVKVKVRGNIIVDAAPIVKRFVGQPLDNLRLWMRKQPEYSEARISS